MRNQDEIRRYLSVIKRAVAFVETLLEDDGGLLERMAAQPSDDDGQAQFRAARRKHVADLMAIECWPEAVPAFLAGKEPSREDQVNRAGSVIDSMIGRSLDGTSFLDFGCGDGWIAQQAVRRGVAKSFGYDPKRSDTWETLRDATFATNLEELGGNRFDIVMVYDVLDHCEDPIEAMKQVRSVLKDDGVVYARCHPWTSKHATHMFRSGVNRAYLHLFLTPEEVAVVTGKEPMFTRVEKTPLEAYRWWFSGFDIRREWKITEPPGDFFLVPSFKDLLANEQGLDQTKTQDFLTQMQIQFVDYTLAPKQ